MHHRKKGFFKRLFRNNPSVSLKSYSSDKPGFIDVINKGIDDNRLKGGFRKYEKTI
jgi:hypothetical protein